MRILVLGGTYFLGKAFVELSCETNDITLLNRGNRKVRFRYPAHIRQITMDRHHLTKDCLAQEHFDVVVDFCAYEKGDIRQVMDALGDHAGQYIFISTSDVYQRGTKQPIDEDKELETRDFGQAAGAYITGKVALEKELLEVAARTKVRYTSLRPAFLYGPGNYADNREALFFYWIEQAGQILCPKDATGSFQMVYVEDAAKVILQLCGNPDAYDRAFNLCGNEIITYQSFCDALAYAVNDRTFEIVEISLEEIKQRKLPLPFPLEKEESETYVSKNGKQLPILYTKLKEGLRMTYKKRREDMIFQRIDALFDENKPKEAEAYMLTKLQEAKDAADDRVVLKIQNELIGYYRQTSEKEKLLTVIQDAMLLLKKMEMEETVEYATTMLNIANAYRSLGKLADAKKYYAITENIFHRQIQAGRMEEKDMLVAGLYNNRSLLFQEMQEYPQAQSDLKKALSIVTEHQAGFEIAVTYANLANTAVMAKQYEKAEDYARTAIRRFKARGLKDAHYCAALSALGTCYLETGNIRRAKKIFEEALWIVEETIGRNSQYERIEENCRQCDALLARKESRNGMELAKAYYREYGKKMIEEKFPEYSHRIAVGLVGEGSDCYGYDDELSSDHDFGPDFCMWLSDETYELIGDKLQKAYDELPRTFGGYTRKVTDFGKGRRGVLRISDFYKKFLGSDQYETIDFAGVEDYALSACVNGEVFVDDEGIFTAMRQRIKEGYPADIRLLKIAQEAAGFSQCAQYNFVRMLLREDEVTAGILLSDGMKHAMKLYHFIMRVYPPHDKWLYQSTKGLPGGEEMLVLLDKVMNRFFVEDNRSKTVENTIEQLGAFLARKLYEANDISDMDAYLDHHTQELIFKADMIRCSKEELVQKIVKLEFEAFDKVKNEGGRAYCQNDWPTFSIMRKSQYLTWNHAMLLQYFYDFSREYQRGHNLITEKYGRMMESTAPEKYAEFKDQFPALSPEKKAVIEQIVGIQMNMMEEFAKVHPKVAMNARTLHTYEDSLADTSYETYLRGEISTYSDKMLQLYGRYVVSAVQNNENIARQTMEHTARLYGYRDLEEFELRS